MTCMEFAVLLGLDSGTQGYIGSYPHACVRQPCTLLAGWFRRADYHTLAMYPYRGDFFDWHRVLPLVYFDRFLDIRHFSKAWRAGPYVADLVVADAI